MRLIPWKRSHGSKTRSTLFYRQIKQRLTVHALYTSDLNIKGKKAYLYYTYTDRNRHLRHNAINKHKWPHHVDDKKGSFICDSVIGFDIYLVFWHSKFFVWKNNFSLKGRFTRLKTKQNIVQKLAVWRVNNSKAKELTLLRIRLEKAI
jgi:hypothetical protein